MSSPEGDSARRSLPARASAVASIVLICLSAAACTVRPLYSNAVVPGAAAPMSAALASIAVNPVSTREAQQVRNQLIFLLAGGRGNPTESAYTLNLVVTRHSSAAAVVQSSTTTQSPTSSLLTMTGFYTLTESATGEVVARGSRQVSSAYDVPQQQFAALRSQRDAENRAARELAEQLRFAVAQDLAKGK